VSNPRYRGPNGHPQTLGEFVRLDWSIRWSCVRCNLTDMLKADMMTALALWRLLRLRRDLNRAFDRHDATHDGKLRVRDRH
jgi:hypothetical protein